MNLKNEIKNLYNHMSKCSSQIFVVALVLYLTSLMLGTTAYFTRNMGSWPGKILLALELLSYLVFLVKAIIDFPKISLKKKIIYILLLISFLISGIVIEHKFFFLTAIIFMAADDMNDDKLICTSLIIETLVFAVTIILAKIGIAEDYIFYQIDRTRAAMGFGWATTAPIMFFYITLGYIYLRKDKFKWYEAIMLQLVNYYVYKCTLTRLTFIMTTFVLVFFWIQTLWKKPWKILSKLNPVYLAVPVLFTIISYLAPYFYKEESPIWYKIDMLLNSRLMLGQWAIQKYGITVFGQPIEWVGAGILNDGFAENYNYVDCSYLQLLLMYGIIPFIFIIGIYIYGIFRSIKNDNYWAVFVLLATLVHAVTEPHLIGFSMNIMVLLPLAKIKQINSAVKTEEQSV